ncbi:MAG: M23 family metallopeptidase [Propionibacteriaceae bacterium]|nr:M23 family metallopeptidase [Propionibacteriaceae bacterium]
MSLALLAGPAQADDDLEQRKDELAGQATEAQAYVDGQAALLADANQRVADAEARVAAAETDVANAQARVAAAQDEVTKAQEALKAAQAAVALAKAHDDLKAEELAAAQQDLTAAQAREKQGEATLAEEHQRLAELVAASFQQNSSLISIATVLDFTGDISTLGNRIQWAQTSAMSQQESLDRLKEVQRQLITARGETQVAEARADDAKAAAAAQLAQTQELEAQAEAAEAAVEAALASQQAALADEQTALAAQRDALAGEEAAKADAATELAAAEDQLAAIQREQEEVNAEIARRAEEARLAAEEAARQAASSAAGASGSGYTGSTSWSGLIRPISASESWISSPYGWRYNPIGGYSELHDGTDFAANCWTPIRAVAAGTVIKSYFGDGYGNRVFVDHGWVNGHYLISAYNHMVQPGLPVGTWVNQGDIVGYVGTTGYSTGCHLHFHLYVDGVLVDPMGYL